MSNYPPILDMTCGGRMMWFDKQHPQCLYVDKRTDPKGCIAQQRNFSVEPDQVADFRDPPFPDDTFRLVVFDPPHADISGASIIGLKYGTLEGAPWDEVVIPGLVEGYRVLAPHGVLIFKWNEVHVSIGEVLQRLPGHIQPLFGHTTAKSGKTKWVTFMKLVVR